MAQLLNRIGKFRLSNPALDFLALSLIVTAHFTNFLLVNAYGIWFPDILLALLLFAGAALVLVAVLNFGSWVLRHLLYAAVISLVVGDVIFGVGAALEPARLIGAVLILLVTLGLVVFLREHTSKVIIAVFLAMLCSSFVLTRPPAARIGEAGAAARPAAAANLPPIVHLVLDEHMGLGGMTPALPGGTRTRDELLDLFGRNGFRVYSNAYSEFFRTARSLGSALNFETNPKLADYLRDEKNKLVITANGYFDAMKETGYAVDVYQSSYIDFCGEFSYVNRCVVYNHDWLDSDVVSGLPAAQRTLLLLNTYLSSFAVTKLIKWLMEENRDDIGALGFEVPNGGLWHARLGPIAVTSTFDRLIADLGRMQAGHLYFAHFLMPHYPYVFTADCQLREPVTAWQTRYVIKTGDRRGAWRQRYRDYLEQVRCTRRKLDQLFAAIRRSGRFDEAVILVHGDHGSRIMLREPKAENAAAMSSQDFADGYSTLFAVKAHWAPPGVDRRVVSLTWLMAFAAEKTDPAESVAEAQPQVYMEAPNGRFLPVPLKLPALGE